MEEEVFETKKREILRLLQDRRAFFSPFGGSAAADSMLNLEAAGSYGPAGLIFVGTEFEKEDRQAIKKSLLAVAAALVRLQQQESIGRHPNGDNISGAGAYDRFIEPYFADPADPSKVDDWRAKAAKGSLVTMRFTQKHDAGIEWLAAELYDVDLHVVFPKLMTEKEEAEIEHQYAEMYAVFQRIRVTGRRKDLAMQQVADNFKVPVSVVERVVEFRSETKPDTCMWGGCDRAPFSQNLCVAHYNQRRRAKLKGEIKSA